MGCSNLGRCTPTGCECDAPYVNDALLGCRVTNVSTIDLNGPLTAQKFAALRSVGVYFANSAEDRCDGSTTNAVAVFAGIGDRYLYLPWMNTFNIETVEIDFTTGKDTDAACPAEPNNCCARQSSDRLGLYYSADGIKYYLISSLTEAASSISTLVATLPNPARQARISLLVADSGSGLTFHDHEVVGPFVLPLLRRWTLPPSVNLCSLVKAVRCVQRVTPTPHCS